MRRRRTALKQAKALRRESGRLGDRYGETLEIELAPGELGIGTTLEAMRAVAVDAARYSPLVQRVAAAVAADAPRKDYAAQLMLLWQFLRNAINFKRDTWAVEHLRHPDQLITEIGQAGHTAADCDDVAVLGAALLMGMGFEPVFIVASRRADQQLEHVFFGARLSPTLVIPLDPQEGYPPGQWPETTRTEVIDFEK